MLILCAVLFGLVLVPVVPSAAEKTGTKCPPAPGRTESCVCKTKEGIIDMTPFSNKDGTARFTGLQDINDYSYSYNPCTSFSGDVPGSCDSVHVCQFANFNPDQIFDIGDVGSEEMWIDTDGTPYLFYTGPSNRETKVFLHCEPSADTPIATTEGDSGGEILHYVFDIRAKAFCFSGSGGVPPGEIGLVIILVILPLGILIYIVAGVLIMKFHYRATGTDVIPNKGFWMAFPLLIKDGFLFTVSPITGLIKGKIGEKKGYESVG